MQRQFIAFCIHGAGNRRDVMGALPHWLPPQAEDSSLGSCANDVTWSMSQNVTELPVEVWLSAIAWEVDDSPMVQDVEAVAYEQRFQKPTDVRFDKN